MNINNNEKNEKTDNLPILRSTSKETKKRFDNLLKNAFNQKSEARKTALSPTKVKGNNIFQKRTDANATKVKESETTTTTSSTEDLKDVTKDTQNNINKANYIMEKFLSDATSIKQEDKALTSDLPYTNVITYIKPPVPLPRKNKKQSSTDESSSNSNLTYTVSSSKITHTELSKEIDQLSFSTATTYTITKPSKESPLPHTPNNINTEIEEPKHQVSAIGDIIIHKSGDTSVTSKKIINIIEQKLPRKISTKIDVSKLPQSEIQKIIDSKYKEIERRRNAESYNSKDDTLNTIVDIEHETDSVNVDTSISTSKLRTESDPIGGIKPYTYENLIGVAVYRCDKLLLSNYINHPCVKIHIVDSVTGKYLRRSTCSDEQAMDLTNAHVYPLITKAYNMQEKRSFVPYWEELLTFDEDFDYMMGYENIVIVFFEILDFLSFTEANTRYSAEGSQSGWHKVAWAFLKPVGKGYLNVEQKVRLQLYKPKKATLLKTSKECMLHDWWKNGELTKYPSSIHVCIKRVKNMARESTLNLDTTQKKNIHTHEVDVDQEKDSDAYSEKIRPKCKIPWTKKSTHSCKIPTKILSDYKTSDKGCFILKFSNDGYLMAGGVATLTKYPIYIYSITDANIYCKFQGHGGLIYDFNWSVNDVYLISAASDCTVCIWNVSTKEYYPIQTLPHPSFVYCVLLKSLEENEIVTGCYDKILRVWEADNKVNVGTNYNLKQELEGHTGYITSICSRKHEDIMYSSDSLGVVIEWSFDSEKWNLAREFKFKEYLNTIINRIILHPKGERLFVFCRDSTIRLIDLNVNCILQWYKGALNDRLLLTGCVTPCGNSVFGSSEDGTICIWNTNTGMLRGTYNPYMRKSKVLTIPYCIEYHPFEHMVAFCHYGSAIPVLLCIYHNSYEDIDLQYKNLETISIVKREKRTKKTKKKKVNESIKKNIKTNTNNVVLEGIIGKIDDVLISAKTQ